MTDGYRRKNRCGVQKFYADRLGDSVFVLDCLFLFSKNRKFAENCVKNPYIGVHYEKD